MPAGPPPSTTTSNSPTTGVRRVSSTMLSMSRIMKFARAQVERDERADGSVLRSIPQKLAPYARCVTEWPVHWSDGSPERVFLAERNTPETWKKTTYREAYGAVRRIGQALLDRGLGAEKPLAILSDNSVEHALLALGAMHVGVPVAPVSPAYSLMSKDFGQLRYLFELVRPGQVHAAEPQKLSAALDAVKAPPVEPPEQ